MTSAGLALLLAGRSGGLPRLGRLDVSGCLGIKGAVSLPPLLTVSSLRAMHLPSLTALTVQLPPAAPLEHLAAGAYTRPLFGSTEAVPDTKCTLHTL